jgi:hypothetical protein
VREYESETEKHGLVQNAFKLHLAPKHSGHAYVATPSTEEEPSSLLQLLGVHQMYSSRGKWFGQPVPIPVLGRDWNIFRQPRCTMRENTLALSKSWCRIYPTEMPDKELGTRENE